MKSIVSDRIELNRLTEGDAARIYDYRSRPDVFQYQSWIPENVDAARQFIRQYAMPANPQLGRWNQLGIYLKATGQLIGDCGFNWKKPDLTEIGFTIHPDFQRQGYGRETAAALVRYLRESLQIQRIIARTHPQNRPSIQLLTNVGFVRKTPFWKWCHLPKENRFDCYFIFKETR